MLKMSLMNHVGVLITILFFVLIFLFENRVNQVDNTKKNITVTGISLFLFFEIGYLITSLLI